MPKSSTARCRPRLRRLRRATVDALTSASSAVSVISSHSESAGIPVWPSTSATRSANAGSTTWRVPDVDRQRGVGERQVARPPAGELGQGVARGSSPRSRRSARSPRPSAGTGPGVSRPRSGCSQRASASKPVTWPVVSSTIGWKYGTISPRSRPRRSSVAVRSASTVVSCVPGANASTQSRPRALARYIAASASRSRSAAVTPSRSFTDTPMLALTNSSVPSTTTASAHRRRGRPRPRPAGRAPASRSTTMNSSPPKRASTASAPDDVAQAHRHRREQRVADAVAEAVVDRLEVVEVDEQQGDVADVGVGEDARRRGAISSVRFGRPVRSSWVAAHCSRSAVRRCSVTSSMWVMASATPSSSVTATRVRGPHELAVAAQVALVEQVGVGDAQLEPGPVRRPRPAGPRGG